MRHAIWILLMLSIVAQVEAQTPPVATPTTVDSPEEIDKLKETCGSFNIVGCGEVLFTGHPLHIAVGSIAPQNGFAGGLAYVGGNNTDNWRINWNADGVVSTNTSWRAGVYAKFVHVGGKGITSHLGTNDVKPNLTNLPEHTVYALFAQTISLNKLTYFGIGTGTSQTNRSFYGMRETVTGGNVVKPINDRFKIAAFGEANGRFVDLRSSTGQPSPSIEQLYTNTTAPGLATQPGVLQIGEGLRMARVFANDIVRINYRATYQQYISAGSTSSFQRLTFDLGHQFALYGKTTRMITARSGNGPDDCALDPSAKKPECPKVFTRNLEGSLGIRLVNVLSMTQGSNAVPFYFQPTLGGSDVNGTTTLGSYEDYRFRAPDILLLRENFEHSIGRLPIGVTVIADEGKVGLTRGALGSAHWVHSLAAGLTLRAGGFPEVALLFAWGGREGTHTSATVNSGLLGGGSRPPLD